MQAEGEKAARDSMAATEQRAAEWCRQELESVAADFSVQLQSSNAEASSQ